MMRPGQTNSVGQGFTDEAFRSDIVGFIAEVELLVGTSKMVPPCQKKPGGTLVGC